MWQGKENARKILQEVVYKKGKLGDQGRKITVWLLRKYGIKWA
jgi:hypothetical protein